MPSLRIMDGMVVRFLQLAVHGYYALGPILYLRPKLCYMTLLWKPWSAVCDIFVIFIRVIFSIILLIEVILINYLIIVKYPAERFR